MATSIIIVTSTSIKPTWSIGEGGYNPHKNNIQFLPTYGGGSLLDSKKVGDKDAKKDKEKKEKNQEQIVVKDSSPMPIVNLNGDNNPLDGDGKDQGESKKGNILALVVTKTFTFLFSNRRKDTPPVARKLFDPSAL